MSRRAGKLQISLLRWDITEVGMSNLVKHFQRTILSDIELSSQVVVEEETSVQDTVMAMANADTSCAFVMSGQTIAGIFTEHDVTHRVVESPDIWDQPVAGFMTPDPYVIDRQESALTALRTMGEGGFRNLPVILDDEGLYRNVTHYDLILLASRYLETEETDDQEFKPEHALRFVDFYGMPSRVPVEVTADAILFDVIGLMKSRDRGLISIVDDRGIVVGEFTQHDVFRKVACRVDDLNDHEVGDWMSTEFASVSPSDNIASGLLQMAQKRHRYLVLTNETGRSVGIVTFRDIAQFFEAAFAVA
jgi:CBS domain-containing protein